MSVPSQRFAFEGAVSPGGTFPPIGGIPLDEPSVTDAGIGGSSADWTLATKKLDESVTSNTTPQKDDYLFFPMSANIWYEGDLSIVVLSASGSPDFKYLMQVDSGSLSGEMHVISNTGLNPGVVMTTTLTESLAANTRELIRVFFIASANTTTVGALWWSQNTISAIATIVKAGSRLRYRRLG